MHEFLILCMTWVKVKVLQLFVVLIKRSTRNWSGKLPELIFYLILFLGFFPNIFSWCRHIYDRANTLLLHHLRLNLTIRFFMSLHLTQQSSVSYAEVNTTTIIKNKWWKIILFNAFWASVACWVCYLVSQLMLLSYTLYQEPVYLCVCLIVFKQGYAKPTRQI